jgi:NAD(P)-dependent dehydrogenase (short-subunit alcohol dehydrogenase family)
MNLTFDLTGKVAVVTGGGGVLCSGFAKTLAAAGAKVAVCDLRYDAAAKVADEITANGGIAIACEMNVLEKASVEAAEAVIREKLGNVDILLNGETVDAFATMVHRTKARTRGIQMCKALAETIPPHQFKIPVQAAIGKEIIAREDIRPFRKDVLAKLYGGDVTRKMKVLEKQKRGKARMKEFGHVNVPQSAFIAVLKGTIKES